MKQAVTNSAKFKIDTEEVVFKRIHDFRQKELQDVFDLAEKRKILDKLLNT
jgi:hypothetical protein